LPAAKLPRFAPVVVAAESEPSGSAQCSAAAAVVEVMLRNGRVMRVPEHATLARVVGLADALDGRGS
jgi:hypothetical protein